MNYIYDIVLNFNLDFYFFYDWNKKDHIENIRKIPVFKVEEAVMKDFLTYDILVSDKILEKIKYKTEVYERKKIKKKRYAFLLTDTYKAIAVEILSNKVFLSDLLIEEDEMVNTSAIFIEKTNFLYEKLKRRTKVSTKTRKVKAMQKKILKELDKIENEEKLKYLYLEYFNKEQENIITIRQELKKEMKENYKICIQKLEPLLKLTKNIV